MRAWLPIAASSMSEKGRISVPLPTVQSRRMDVAPASQLAAHVDAGGVGQRHAGIEQGLGDVHLEQPFDPGELALGVHAEALDGRLRVPHGHRVALGDRGRHDVGQIVLALRVGVGEAAEPAGELREGCRDDAGVHLAHGTLGFRGVAFLDDARDAPGGIADDAPIALRVVHLLREQGELALRRRIGQCPQGAARDPGHVAVQDEHHALRFEPGEGLEHGVSGAQLFLLHRPGDIGRGQAGAHGFAAMADHDRDARGRKAPGAVEDVLEHRPPAQGMQHLRQVRVHALALAGGQDDDLEDVGGHSRETGQIKRAGSWDPARMCCASKSRSFVISPLNQGNGPLKPLAPVSASTTRLASF